MSGDFMLGALCLLVTLLLYFLTNIFIAVSIICR
ncbi:hypothetical protein SODG_005474 [Sodalis praecaptivus]